MRDSLELNIAATSIRDLIPKDAPLRDRIEFAFRYAREHERDIFWMSGPPNDDMLMRTGLAAVMLAGTEDDKEMITRSLAPLKALSALLSGVPVDMSQIDTENTLPLMQIFNEAREPKTEPSEGPSTKSDPK